MSAWHESVYYLFVQYAEDVRFVSWSLTVTQEMQIKPVTDDAVSLRIFLIRHMYAQWLKWFCEAGGGLTWRSQVGANPIPIPTPLIWRYLGVK